METSWVSELLNISMFTDMCSLIRPLCNKERGLVRTEKALPAFFLTINQPLEEMPWVKSLLRVQPVLMVEAELLHE